MSGSSTIPNIVNLDSVLSLGVAALVVTIIISVVVLCLDYESQKLLGRGKPFRVKVLLHVPNMVNPSMYACGPPSALSQRLIMAFRKNRWQALLPFLHSDVWITETTLAPFGELPPLESLSKMEFDRKITHKNLAFGGVEDARLFFHHKYLYAIGAIRGRTTKFNQVIVRVCEIDKDVTTVTEPLQCRDLRLEAHPDGSGFQEDEQKQEHKNWVPLGQNPHAKNEYLFEYSLEPHAVASVELHSGRARFFSRVHNPPAFAHLGTAPGGTLRLGTNSIRISESRRLAVGRVVRENLLGKAFSYRVVFYEFEASSPFRVTRVSDELYLDAQLQRSRVQMPLSLSMVDTSNVVIAFGDNDDSALFARASLQRVLLELNDETSLPLSTNRTRNINIAHGERRRIRATRRRGRKIPENTEDLRPLRRRRHGHSDSGGS